MGRQRRIDIWRIVDRTRAGMLKSSTRRARKGLKEQMQPILDFLPDRADELNSTIVDSLIEQGPIKEMMADIYYTVGLPFAKAVYGSLQKAEFTDDVFGRAVINEVETAGMMGPGGKTLVKDMTDTTIKEINKIISAAFEEGISIQAAAATIESHIRHMSNVRATMIARTETIRASNFGALQGAKFTELKLQKEWISTFDDRTRDDHLAADGQIVGRDELFDVGGDQLPYPAAANGQPGNTINCRCTLAFIPVE